MHKSLTLIFSLNPFNVSTLFATWYFNFICNILPLFSTLKVYCQNAKKVFLLALILHNVYTAPFFVFLHTFFWKPVGHWTETQSQQHEGEEESHFSAINVPFNQCQCYRQLYLYRTVKMAFQSVLYPPKTWKMSNVNLASVGFSNHSTTTPSEKTPPKKPT